MKLALDIETTGLEPDKHGLIQIGLFSDTFAVAWDVDPGPVSYDKTAMEINGFTMERIAKGVPYTAADLTIAAWLTNDYGVADGSIIPVGWNVGTFDMPFVETFLPKTRAFFHPYRALDLNSACFLYADLVGIDFDTAKKRAKAAAEKAIGYTQEHDAGWDARASWEAYQWLRGKK